MSLYSKISIKIFSNVSVKKIDAIKRPTYSDFIKISNNVSKCGDILIIANTDIFPSRGVREKLEAMKQNDCYALSRYDVKKTIWNMSFLIVLTHKMFGYSNRQ